MQQVISPKIPSPPAGLSADEVQTRISKGQSNAFKARVGRTYWQIVNENLFNLFNLVLGTLLFIVIWFGDYATAVFAGTSVVTNTLLGMVQEINAKRKLDKLAALAQGKVRVWRAGTLQAISPYEVVVDDLLPIEPGERVPVDGVVLHSDALEMDESLLTGESDAIFKEIGQELHSGSFCIAGSGLMRATKVGRESTINKLSVVAKQYKRSRTPTQRKLDIVVELTVVGMFIVLPLLMIGNYIILREPFIDAVRNTLVFVTSLVPQGLVLVATLSLTIGALKISRQRTLVQRVNAVESLANATVLCFDKTGTLTRNQLSVTDVLPVQGDEQALLGQLARYLHNLSHLNRTAAAVREYVDARLPAAPVTPKLREVPFTSARKWGAVLWEGEALALGAPERLINLDDPAHAALMQRISALSAHGKRVLALKHFVGAWDIEAVQGQGQVLALVALNDQIRPDIQATLQAFRDQDIDLKVISGDSPITVSAIAAEAGMTVTAAYTGAQLAELSDEQLDSVVREANVFARIEPDTKKRLVASLQRQGHYVAMVGDGVNDVPALKQANLAIVMNDGTQISKDVADIVLLDNAMSTLPKAFAEGTSITQIIFGTCKMFLGKNAFNIILYLLIPFMYLPFPITAIQVSWATFGAVNIPATLVAFGWWKPSPKIRSFRHDVLDFVFVSGIIGTIPMLLMFVLLYLLWPAESAVDAARTAVTIFVALYQGYLVMNVVGVDILRPRSFLEQWRVVLPMLLLLTLTLLAMYAFPAFFKFTIFTLANGGYVIGLLVLLFLLAMLVHSLLLHQRYFTRRFWQLVDDEKR